MARLVRENPFAVVVSALPGQAPVASHVPLILAPDIDPDGSLVGTVLLGHMGRANPQWEHFREPTQILLVFASSHGYVSPGVYDFAPAAPTLDYATVHLTGDVELIEGREETMEVVLATVAALEGQRPTPWDPTASRELHERIIGAVVGFRVHVTAQQSMFKLSQDMSDHVRGAVRDDFAEGPHRHPQLVTLMDRLEDERP